MKVETGKRIILISVIIIVTIKVIAVFRGLSTQMEMTLWTFLNTVGDMFVSIAPLIGFYTLITALEILYDDMKEHSMLLKRNMSNTESQMTYQNINQNKLTQTSGNTQKICTICKYKCSPDSLFCPECGSSLF